MAINNIADGLVVTSVCPFPADPQFLPFNTGYLAGAILRAADAIRKNPDKEVWIAELTDGLVTLFVGGRGNFCASVNLGGK